MESDRNCAESVQRSELMPETELKLVKTDTETVQKHATGITSSEVAKAMHAKGLAVRQTRAREKKKAWLMAYAADTQVRNSDGTVRIVRSRAHKATACEVAGCTIKNVIFWMSDDPDFAEACHQIEETMCDAVECIVEDKIFNDKSDVWLEKWLRAHRPEIWGDKNGATNINVNDNSNGLVIRHTILQGKIDEIRVDRGSGNNGGASEEAEAAAG
jgi:hypothetical protein